MIYLAFYYASRTMYLKTLLFHSFLQNKKLWCIHGVRCIDLKYFKFLAKFAIIEILLLKIYLSSINIKTLVTNILNRNVIKLNSPMLSMYINKEKWTDLSSKHFGKPVQTGFVLYSCSFQDTSVQKEIFMVKDFVKFYFIFY